MSTSEGDIPKSESVPGVGGAGGVADGQEKSLAEWTILIYMSGDNDLSHHCIRALTEIKSLTGADPDKVHVVAQIDPEDRRMPTRRFVINKELKRHKPEAGSKQPGKPGERPVLVLDGSKPGQLDKDKVDMGPGKVRLPRRPAEDGRRSADETETTDRPRTPADWEANMAHPATLFDFVSRSVQDWPAHHYMLILDGHAAGVEEGFLLKDANPPGSMSFDDLKWALTAVRDALGIRLEVLGLNSCLMNMAEVCYEFRRLADIVVGSQGLIPGRGWPFSWVIASLNAEGGKLDAEELASLFVKKFMDFYLEDSVIGGLSVDVGALLLEKSADVTREVGTLAGLLTAGLGVQKIQDGIILSHWRAQSYNGELYVDLWDFCQMLVEHCDSYATNGAGTEDADKNKLLKSISTQCGKVQDAIKAMVVNACFVGVEYQHSHGLSIYFPWSEIFANYEKLEFAKSGWGKFLLQYLKATRRETRGGAGAPYRAEKTTAEPWRKDPPSAGPAQPAHSMRNPPINYPENIECLSDPQKLKDYLDKFNLLV